MFSTLSSWTTCGLRGLDTKDRLLTITSEQPFSCEDLGICVYPTPPGHLWSKLYQLIWTRWSGPDGLDPGAWVPISVELSFQQWRRLWAGVLTMKNPKIVIDTKPQHESMNSEVRALWKGQDRLRLCGPLLMLSEGHKVDVTVILRMISAAQHRIVAILFIKIRY